MADRRPAVVPARGPEDADACIDEIPAAYKDVEQVMADAADLADIRYRLRQIVNVKDN